jgi:predicted permease
MMLDTFAQDLRIAVRGLLRRPVFFAVATITLAVGIGANTAIFSVVNGVLLRPLPYATADELVIVNVAPNATSRAPGFMSYPDLADLREAKGTFRTLVGVNATSMTLTGAGDPVILDVSRVTEGVLSTFGVSPVYGRDVRRDEFGAGGPRVAVLGHGLWRERFGADHAVLGKSITLNGNAYEIVGVAPAGFEYPRGVSIWIPRALDLTGCGRDCHSMQAVGRLAAGVSVPAAQVALQHAGANLERAYPDTNTGKRFLMRGLKQALVGDVEAGIWITFACALLVLLITCANVANLLLARASARAGEVAVRAALGASRGRLAAQVLLESGVLAALGGATGIALALAGVSALRKLASSSIPRTELIAIDSTVLLVTLISIALVMTLFGTLPALTASRASVGAALTRIGRNGAGALSTTRLRRVLLTGEVALSASLLICAGLLLRTFTQLQAVNVGFETREVSRFSVVLPESDYPQLERAVQFYSALEREIAALPGVEAVGTMFAPPLGRGYATGGVLVEGRPAPPPGNEPEAYVRSVTPNLLATLRIPLRHGRLLQAADNVGGTEPVALVNEQFVREHFPNEDPIGKRVTVTVDVGYGSPRWRIVGVVGDVRFTSLREAARADIYLPHAQYGPLSMTVHVRTAAGAPAILQPVREIVRRLDPNVPVYRAETIEQVVDTAAAPTRLYLVLVALFAVTAALLAAVGLYGVVSYIVVQRTREIGVRMALGARRATILTLVVGQGMQPVIIGLIMGVGVALAGAGYLESVLFGVSPRDPIIFSAATVLMAVVALLAAAIPAARASGIDPAKVLHGG